MRNRTKLVLTAFAATLVMATTVSAAAAQRLSVNDINFRINWARISFSGDGGLANPSIECRLTLEGRFHSNVIPKSLHSLVGYVTRAIVSPANQCTGGAVTILTASLPWHVRYRNFTGRLPNIERVRLLLGQTVFQVEALGFQCLYREGSEDNNVTAGEVIREAGGSVTTLEVDESIRLRLFSGSGFCPPRGGVRGGGQMFSLGSNTTRISLSLI